MPVLYRKYRPQTFADVAGQEHVKRTLAEEVASGRIAHSYLFTGPRGVGKTTTARIFAKAVNCAEREKGSGEPCGACASCVQIAEGRALDVVEIDAASHTGVDNVREQVIEHARFAPTESKYKVFIIDEVHMLSTSAFNALLKTLEEPPEHVLFVLATTELHKLPATVVSRCQRFDFRRIGRDDLLARLRSLVAAEGAEVEEPVLEAVARHSEGCLRDAESLLTQLLSLGEEKVGMETAALVLPSLSSDATEKLARALAERDAASALAVWERLSADGADLLRAVDDLIDHVRRDALEGLKGASDGLSARLGPAGMSALLTRLLRVREEMRRMDLVELPFEMMAMEWAVGQGPSANERDATKRARPEGQGPDDAATAPPAASGPPGEAQDADTEARESEPAVSAPEDAELFEKVQAKWSDIVMRSQEKNQGLPYMLGAAELLGVESGTLKVGFRYALYRDRLNGKCKRMFEEVASEIVKAKVLVRGVLLDKPDEAEEEQKLPDGFAELVNDFGGSLAS